MIPGHLEIIGIITAFQLVLLTVVLLTHKTGKRSSNRLLAGFMLFNALFIGNYLITHLKFPSWQYPKYLFYVGISLYLTLGPMLYFYTKSLCYQRFSAKKNWWLHFLPFILVAAFLSVNFLYRSQLNLSLNAQKFSQVAESLVYNGFLHLQISIYILLIFRTLKKYHRELKNLYSAVEKINLSWLLYILGGFAVMWILDLANFLLDFFRSIPPFVPDLLTFLSLTANFLFATFIVFKGLKHPDIISGIEERAKYAHSRLTPTESKRHIQKLKRFMHEQKPYLNPSITITELAEKLAIPPRYLSQELNDLMKQNFFDFINHYRIKEAESLLSDPASSKKTILEILYEVGFNSKSAFNAAFKKHTGLTPKEFKRKNLLSK